MSFVHPQARYLRFGRERAIFCTLIHRVTKRRPHPVGVRFELMQPACCEDLIASLAV